MQNGYIGVSGATSGNESWAATVHYQTNKWIIILALVAFMILAFAFRNLIRRAFKSKLAVDITYIAIGSFMIAWELFYDISGIAYVVNRHIADGDYNSAIAFSTFGQNTLGALMFCRLNMYLIGITLVLRKYEWMFTLVATPIFGAFALFYAWGDNAPVHSLITHIMLIVAPTLTTIISRKQYTVKKLRHTFYFNLSLVATNLILNELLRVSINELVPGVIDGGYQNMVVALFPGWGGVFFYISCVCMAEFVIFFGFRLMWDWDYKRNKKQVTNFGYWKSIKEELKTDLFVDWWGFKSILVSLTRNKGKDFKGHESID